MIRDLPHTLSMETGRVEIITPKINGFLKNFIVSSWSGITFDVHLESPNVLVCSEVDVKGSVAITPRVRQREATSNYGFKFGDVPLNDKLRIVISGARNNEVLFIVRFSTEIQENLRKSKVRPIGINEGKDNAKYGDYGAYFAKVGKKLRAR